MLSLKKTNLTIGARINKTKYLNLQHLIQIHKASINMPNLFER